MEVSRRDIAKVEKPGRLQLAILEWQRQLLAKRAARGELRVLLPERPADFVCQAACTDGGTQL
jgi:hypothetical protein